MFNSQGKENVKSICAWVGGRLNASLVYIHCRLEGWSVYEREGESVYNYDTAT